MAKVVETLTISREEEIADCKKVMKNILNYAIEERRSMTNLEQQKYDKYKNRLEELENENRKENEQMKNKSDLNFELREKLNNEGLVDVSDIEYRANVVDATADTGLGTNTQHGVPMNFVQGVVFDAVHNNYLLNMVKVMQTENTSRVTVADYIGAMKDLKEMEEIELDDFVTTEKDIVLKRKGVATMVSRHLIASANFDVRGHVSNIFAHSLAVTCEELVAKALDGDTEVEAAKVQYKGSLLKALVAQLAVMPEALRQNSAIIMNPQAYQAMLSEEDAVGRNLLDFQYENSLRAKVCGVPVIISEKVQAVYVGSLRDAVTVALAPRGLEAENLPRRDAVSFAFNVHCGATVVLPKAVVKVVKATE